MTAPERTDVPDREQIITQLNEQYAVLLLGDRTVVLREELSEDGEPGYRMLSVEGFKEWTRPSVIWEHDDEGNSRKLQISKLWLESAKRRQYKGLVFDPSTASHNGYYNLWRGWAVEPSPRGSCQRFLDHLAENVCQGDEALFSWVVGWFAALVQRPTEKLGTSLVLRGSQGTGKTIVGRIIGSLLGPHYALVADSRYIVGRFNSHLASCLLLQLDEATWGGDHAAAGKLKDLITGEWQHIEYKGREPVKVRNYIRLLITGNNSWLVPAGLDERRFAVLDVGEAQRQSHAYFQAIDDEMNAGGREALLHYLLTLDLTDIPLRSIPHTGALVEQQVSSLPPEQQWWLDVLRSGVLPGDRTGTGEVGCRALYKHYLDEMQQRGVTRRLSETGFGIALRRITSGVTRDRRSIATAAGQKRCWIYVFPPLDTCRAEFARRTGELEVPDGAPTEWHPDGDP